MKINLNKIIVTHYLFLLLQYMMKIIFKMRMLFGELNMIIKKLLLLYWIIKKIDN